MLDSSKKSTIQREQGYGDQGGELGVVPRTNGELVPRLDGQGELVPRHYERGSGGGRKCLTQG